MVYDGASTLNFYFNGELAHSDTAFNVNNSNLNVNTNNLVIGGLTGSEGFLGQLDEIRIWNVLRSQNKIVSYKNRQLLGNEDNLQAYYTLDNNALIVDGFQEAVRDYAGNTKGSTASGITWIEGDQAAPLLIETLVQDIPVSISTNINKDQIIISPINVPEYYLEGAKLTAVFSGERIKGVDGNMVLETSWSFSINKNNVNWNKANIIANQSVGQSITIDAILKNSGGTNATFELQGLPIWLKCNNPFVGANVALNAGFENTLTFNTSAYLNKGTYFANIGVITYNQAGVKTGYEYFSIELNVNCQTPSYTFNSAAFAHKKEFTAQLTIAGESSIDTNDIIVAYYNDQVRGKANVTKVNNKNVVLLDVFFNSGEQGALTFRVWDDSNCKEYIGLTQQFTLGNGNYEGTLTVPLQFVTGNVVVKRIPLIAGYQWVSFNSIDNIAATSLSISAIKGMSLNDEISTLLGSKKATFNAAGNPSGGLTALDFRKGYQVKSATDKLMLVQGVEAPIKTDIQIVGQNVFQIIGYIPNVMLNTSYALRSLSNKFAIGDRISGREGFSEFTTEGWKGTLTHLTPNKSYSIKMFNSGILNYSGFTDSASRRMSKSTAITHEESKEEEANDTTIDVSYLKKAAQKGIVVDQYNLPYTMSLTASVVSDHIDINKEYIVVAESKGQYRGVAKAVINNNQLVYFMTIYGANQENISFKLMSEDETFDIDNTLLFDQSSFVGSIDKPYPLQVSKKLNYSNEILSIDQNPVTETAIVTINPSVTDYFELDLYNLMGIKIATLYTGTILAKSGKTIELDRSKNANLTQLPSGAYLCNLRGSNTLNTLKVIFK